MQDSHSVTARFTQAIVEAAQRQGVSLPERDRRAITFEMGIQNSGLGLILIFNFFNGLGGMAIVTAWWGIWHIVAGMTLATFWKSRPPTGMVTGDKA